MLVTYRVPVACLISMPVNVPGISMGILRGFSNGLQSWNQPIQPAVDCRDFCEVDANDMQWPTRQVNPYVF